MSHESKMRRGSAVVSRPDGGSGGLTWATKVDASVDPTAFAEGHAMSHGRVIDVEINTRKYRMALLHDP